MTPDAPRRSNRESSLSRLARERAADRAAGRPERGLVTGRRARLQDEEEDPVEAAYDDAYDGEAYDEELDEELDDLEGETDHRVAGGGQGRGERGFFGCPRTGAKRTMLSAIRQLPSYMRMMLGLMGDSRVSRIDRLFVLGALAYIVSPLDFIPDLIPILGQTDDVFLLTLALQRLLNNTGRRVLLDHWRGDPEELSNLNVAGMLSAASFFLPGSIKRRLARFAGTRKAAALAERGRGRR